MQRIIYAALVSGVLLGAAACGGLPESPEWDVVVAAPFSSDRISVDDFLPPGTTSTQAGGVEVFTLPGIQQQSSTPFSTICPSCPSGSTSTVPAFSYSENVDVDLTQDVVRLELHDGEAVMSVTNGLGFTFLGATGDGSGFVEVVVFDQASGNELGRQRVAGPGTELGPGETLDIQIPLGTAEITDGIRVDLSVASPTLNLPSPVTLSPATSLALDGGLASLQVRAVTVRVDQIPVTRSSQIDVNLDAGAENIVNKRLIGAEIEFQLLHDVAVDGPFDVTLANSEAALFTGNSSNEISLGQFTFAPDDLQTFSLDAATVQRLIDFDEQWIGYEAVGTGTLSDPPGRGPLSRLTPESSFGTRVRIATTFRAGG